MVKRKWPKEQTVIYKTLHQKLKIEQQQPSKKPGGSLRCSRTKNLEAHSGAPEQKTWRLTQVPQRVVSNLCSSWTKMTVLFNNGTSFISTFARVVLDLNVEKLSVLNTLIQTIHQYAFYFFKWINWIKQLQG
jgi:hypothetical protein